MKAVLKEVLINSFLEARFDKANSMLVIDWFATTQNMQKDTYQFVLINLASFVENYGVKKWLENSLLFDFPPVTPVMQAWIHTHFDRQLVKSNLEKMALIRPEAYIVGLVTPQAEILAPSPFTTRYFNDPAPAKLWLLED